MVEDTYGDDRRAEGETGDTDTVVRRGSGDAGDMSAVTDRVGKRAGSAATAEAGCAGR